MSTTIAALIPAPAKSDANGNPIAYYDWTYPRSEAYETEAAKLLPAGWTLYGVIDGQRAAEGKPHLAATAGKDWGASRDDRQAHVFGVRDVDGSPRHLQASIPSRIEGEGGPRKDFAPTELGEAARWCDEVIAKGVERVAHVR